MNDKVKLAIKRSEEAYQGYIKDKLFFQANRIFKANKLLYDLLEELYLDGFYTDETRNFLFHLDDWFLQFDQLKRQLNPSAEDRFIFDRTEGMVPFPKSFEHLL